jgi:hypothetical protein
MKHGKVSAGLPARELRFARGMGMYCWLMAVIYGEVPWLPA